MTNFFRDPEAFDALAKTALPALLKSRPDDSHLPRLGAGLRQRRGGLLTRDPDARMPGSREAPLRRADFRHGPGQRGHRNRARRPYPDGIARTVRADGSNAYFVREDSAYRIRKEIREMTIFAVQNVIKDPPFTKLDLISCRNLLIYLNADLQRRLAADLPLRAEARRPAVSRVLGNRRRRSPICSRSWTKSGRSSAARKRPRGPPR